MYRAIICLPLPDGSGYDPSKNIATGLTPNIDYNRYPRSRTYTFGAQLTFN